MCAYKTELPAVFTTLWSHGWLDVCIVIHHHDDSKRDIITTLQDFSCPLDPLFASNLDHHLVCYKLSWGSFGSWAITRLSTQTLLEIDLSRQLQSMLSFSLYLSRNQRWSEAAKEHLLFTTCHFTNISFQALLLSGLLAAVRADPDVSHHASISHGQYPML